MFQFFLRLGMSVGVYKPSWIGNARMRLRRSVRNVVCLFWMCMGLAPTQMSSSSRIENYEFVEACRCCDFSLPSRLDNWTSWCWNYDFPRQLSYDVLLCLDMFSTKQHGQIYHNILVFLFFYLAHRHARVQNLFNSDYSSGLRRAFQNGRD